MKKKTKKREKQNSSEENEAITPEEALKRMKSFTERKEKFIASIKKARIEIYLPDKPKPAYRRLQKAFENEFLQTFGGATVIKNIKGLYLSDKGKTDANKINLVYANTPFDFDKNFKALAKYADDLREAALAASSEESILVVVHEIYHSA